MTKVNLPEIDATVSSVPSALANASQRALLLAHMTSAGTATDEALNENPSLPELKALSGAGSMAYDAASVFRLYNEITPLDAILVDDPTVSAAATVKAITFTGTATGTGTLVARYGSERKGKATLSVAIGDTAEDIVDNFVTLYAAKSDVIGAVAEDGSVTTQLNFTYNHACTEGNGVPVAISGYVPGITYAVTVDTAGTGVYDATNVLDVINETRYNAIIAPASWGTAYLVAKLDARWNVSNKILDGLAYIVAVDTKANLVTAGDALNSLGIVYRGEKLEARTNYHGAEFMESPLAVAATAAAISTLRLTDGANIANVVSSATTAADKIGGMKIASLPVFNTPTQIPVQGVGFGFTEAEVKELDAAHVSVIGNNSANTAVVFGKSFTTYKTNSSGDADITFGYEEYVQTASQIREYISNNMRSACGQSRLTNGTIPAGVTMDNESTIRSKFLGFCDDLSEAALIQKGPVAREFIDNKTSISLDLAEREVTITTRIPIVTQLGKMIIPIAIVFSTGA
jgi:phage tail sheath gpL-like